MSFTGSNLSPVEQVQPGLLDMATDMASHCALFLYHHRTPSLNSLLQR